MNRAAVIMALTLMAPRLQATEGAAMLKVPAAARSAALGGAFSMVGGNAESMWYNPAGIGGLGGGELGFSHVSWIGGSASEFAFAAIGGTQWGLGAYGQYSGMQDLARDAFGREGALFTNSGQVGGLALAGRFESLRLGLGAKALGQSVAGRSDLGYAGDAGAIASLLDGHLALSLAALNLGTAPQLGAANGAVQPPVNFRAGLGLMRIYGFKFLGEYRRWIESGQSSLAGGAEFMLAYKDAELVWRAGYESGLADGGLAGLSAGIGTGIGGLRLDYSFQALGELGNAQRISVDWRYKTPLPKSPAQPPSDTMNASDDSAARLRQAKAEYDAGHFQAAAVLFARLAEERPTSFAMQAAAAMSSMMSGDKSAAMKYFARARQLKPERKDVEEKLRKLETEGAP